MRLHGDQIRRTRNRFGYDGFQSDLTVKGSIRMENNMNDGSRY